MEIIFLVQYSVFGCVFKFLSMIFHTFTMTSIFFTMIFTLLWKFAMFFFDFFLKSQLGHVHDSGKVPWKTKQKPFFAHTRAHLWLFLQKKIAVKFGVNKQDWVILALKCVSYSTIRASLIWKIIELLERD